MIPAFSIYQLPLFAMTSMFLLFFFFNLQVHTSVEGDGWIFFFLTK